LKEPAEKVVRTSDGRRASIIRAAEKIRIVLEGLVAGQALPSWVREGIAQNL